MDIILKILLILIPIAIVLFIAWCELDSEWKYILWYFLGFGLLSMLIILFGNPFANLHDWQIALFTVIFVLSVVSKRSYYSNKIQSCT